MPDRIGLLDRKLRAISQNIRKYPDGKSGIERMQWTYNRYKCGYGALYFGEALKAFSSTYGYEWQGDNLLLARANLLLTYCEHWRRYFKREPIKAHVEIIAEIVSWNVWQMDGLKKTVPGTDIPCKIYDWKKNEEVPIQGHWKGERRMKRRMIKFDCLWIKAEHHEKLPAGSARVRKKTRQRWSRWWRKCSPWNRQSNRKSNLWWRDAKDGTSAKASHALPTRQ